MKSILSLVLVACALAAPSPRQTTVAGVAATLSAPDASGPRVNAISCSSGQYLTYEIKTQAFTGNRDNAIKKLENWTASAPGTLLSFKDSGKFPSPVGSTRVWKSTDAALGETTNNTDTLVTVTFPTSSSSNLEFNWNAGQSKYTSNGGVTIFSANHDLTLQQASNGGLSFQYYINSCLSSQNYNLLGQILTDGVAFWIKEVQAA